jgi:hypothetical protein
MSHFARRSDLSGTFDYVRYTVHVGHLIMPGAPSQGKQGHLAATVATIDVVDSDCNRWVIGMQESSETTEETRRKQNVGRKMRIRLPGWNEVGDWMGYYVWNLFNWVGKKRQLKTFICKNKIK